MFFDELSIQFVAMESALTLYEQENDLTADYLNSDVLYDSNYAAESVNGESEDMSDSIFADILSDFPAFESEGAASESAPAAKQSFGSKLGGAIKSILKAVANFFRKIGAAISAAFTKTKAASDSAAQVANASIPPAINSDAEQISSLVKQAIGILNTDVQAAANAISKLVGKISKYLNAANKAVGSSNNIEDIKKFNANVVNREGGKNAAGFDGMSDLNDTSAKMDESVAVISNALEKFSDVEQKISDAFYARAKKLEAAGRAHSQEVKGSKYDTAIRKMKDANDRGREGEKAISEYNASLEAEAKAKGKELKDSEKLESNRKNDADAAAAIDRHKFKRIVYAKYVVDKSTLNKIQGFCKTITDTCSKNSSLADNLATSIKDDGKQDEAAYKSTYKLCKAYSKCTSLFSTLSAKCKMILDGSILRENGGKNNANVGVKDINDDDD